MPFTHLNRGEYACGVCGESMCERRSRSVSELWWNNPNAIYPPNQRSVCVLEGEGGVCVREGVGV